MNINAIRKAASWILIIIALWMFSPPGMPPDDIINIIIGGYIATALGTTLTTGILLTYTVIPFAILYLGCMISPADTGVVLKGVLAKVKGLFTKIISDPRLLIAAMVMMFIGYWVYCHYIYEQLGLGTTGVI